ncbi:hypothetical protein L6452_24617 [Arctium lappa]|uniref:Uncharacterized protein n=1 Tax=Arctium lappa TaxID=4217 RepID=A0ACB9ABF9_ARCLA|nr:hypothetical protein L6452_24617 [Arctium lappa]
MGSEEQKTLKKYYCYILIYSFLQSSVSNQGTWQFYTTRCDLIRVLLSPAPSHFNVAIHLSSFSLFLL